MSATDTMPEPHRVAEAKRLVLSGDPQPAIRLLREHLMEEPGDVRAWHRLAGALIAANDLDEALVAATRSVELAPTLATAHRFVALAQFFGGNWEPALESVSRAIALDPTDAEAHALRADILLLSGAPLRRVDAAIRQAVEIDPEHRSVRGTRGYARTARRLRAGIGVFAAAVGAALTSALVIVLVGPAPNGRAAMPLAAGGCVLVAALLIRPVTRARQWVPRRVDAVSVSGAALLAAGVVGGAVAAAGARPGPVIGFGLIGALLAVPVALRLRTTVTRVEWTRVVAPAGGYRRNTTLPNAGTDNIADPGSMDPDTRTEPDTGNPADLDADHERLARDPYAEGDGPTAAEMTGSPVGPPD